MKAKSLKLHYLYQHLENSMICSLFSKFVIGCSFTSKLVFYYFWGEGVQYHVFSGANEAIEVNVWSRSLDCMLDLFYEFGVCPLLCPQSELLTNLPTHNPNLNSLIIVDHVSFEPTPNLEFKISVGHIY